MYLTFARWLRFEIDGTYAFSDIVDDELEGGGGDIHEPLVLLETKGFKFNKCRPNAS